MLLVGISKPLASCMVWLPPVYGEECGGERAAGCMRLVSLLYSDWTNLGGINFRVFLETRVSRF